eukprot:TRINITY_DN5874_c0_g1_i1.p2 TRINITY_DN5874_c0_g1~~TRINITY_DN5874_c0_g1_i1.p2  ORF type:complete len:111 (+),score=43.78 TRINITY_DN5874_c0_g1_i1:27-335(+)
MTALPPNYVPIEACLDSDMENPPIRFAAHFPGTRPECMEDAAVFFYCFTSKAGQITREDKKAGLRGLCLCQKEMYAYDQCMEKAIKRELELKEKEKEKKSSN